MGIRFIKMFRVLIMIETGWYKWKGEKVKNINIKCKNVNKKSKKKRRTKCWPINVHHPWWSNNISIFSLSRCGWSCNQTRGKLCIPHVAQCHRDRNALFNSWKLFSTWINLLAQIYNKKHRGTTRQPCLRGLDRRGAKAQLCGPDKIWHLRPRLYCMFYVPGLFATIWCQH